MPPTSRRGIPATTRARWRAIAPPRAARRWWPEARRPGRRAGWRCRGWSCRIARTAVACPRWSWWICESARPRAGPLHPRTVEALAEVADRGRRRSCCSTAAAGRPFLTCRSCGRAWSCPAAATSRSSVHQGQRRRASLPPLRTRRARSRVLSRLRLGRPRAPRRRHGAAGELVERGRGAAAGVPPRLRQRGRRRRPPRDPAAVRPRRSGRAGRHPDGRQGPRLPRRRAERRAGRRRHPAVSRLPRRGAHLRAGRPAGRAQRPGRAWREGAGPDAGSRRARDPPRGERTTRRGSSPARSSGAGRLAIRRSRT